MVAFTIGASLYVLMPKQSLVFAISGRGLFEGLYAFATSRRRSTPTHVRRDTVLGSERPDPVAALPLVPPRAIGLAIEVIILLISVGGHVFWS